MPGTEIVTRITADTLDAVLREEDNPVLLACIRNDVNLRETLQALETVAVYAGPAVRVCYATEEILPAAESMYQVTGTPTFLLIKRGELLDRLLGKTSAQGLLLFLGSTFTAGRARGRFRGSAS